MSGLVNNKVLHDFIRAQTFFQQSFIVIVNFGIDYLLSFISIILTHLEFTGSSNSMYDDVDNNDASDTVPEMLDEQQMDMKPSSRVNV